MPRRKKSSNKQTNKPVRQQSKFSREITVVALVALALFLLISLFTDTTGKLGALIKDLMLGLFGFPGYFICFLIIAAAIHAIAKRAERQNYKYWCAGCILWVTCVLFSLFANVKEDFFLLGKRAIGGGWFGGIVTLPFIALLGKVGSVIVFITIWVILFIMIFDISVVSVLGAVFRWLKKSMSGASARVNSHIESDYDNDKKQQQIEQTLEITREPVAEEKPPRETKAQKQTKQAELLKAEMERVQGEVQAVQIPDEEAIGAAIDVATEVSLLPKKNRKQEPEQIEIEIVNERVDYKFPQLNVLKEGSRPDEADDEALERTAKKLIDTLKSFGVEARIVDYSRGPTITRYELVPNAGVKISKITSLADDIALNLAAVGIRIEPIAGKSAIGVEVPNETQSPVFVREVIGTQEFASFPSRLAFALGKDIAGKPVIGDIARMPHLLIAGSTGSGKSVCINTLITSILYKASPFEVKMVMIDPKVVELGIYNGIPHLLIPVVTDPRKAAGALQWAVNEMTNRYKLFAENNVRDLASYNSSVADNPDKETLPQIVIIIDELADLMMVAPNDVEDSICRLAQMARAAGMHLVIATQRPSVDVITGVIKANIPSRIAFAVSSFVDSKTILDMGGAEKLLGRGDMLYNPIGANKPQRLQGAYIDGKEVDAIVNIVKAQGETVYDQEVIEQIEHSAEKGMLYADEEKTSTVDALLPEAVELALEAGSASVAMYQRKLKIGYQRAARIIDQMEQRGLIGKFDGTKPREMLITRAQWNELQMNQDFKQDIK